MAGLTLMQRYYGINKALNDYLKSRAIDCPVIKYGIDPATIKAQSNAQTGFKYPYFQSYIRPVNPQAWTSSDAGTLTQFEYQLSFFTGPQDEFANDADKFIPFDVARNALSDVNIRLLATVDIYGNRTTLADLLDVQHHYEFSMKTGQPVPAAFLIAKMRAVCAYPISIPDATLSTDIDNAITTTWSNI